VATSLLGGDRRIDLAHVNEFSLGAARVRPGLLQIECGAVKQLVEPRVMQMLVALHAAGGATVTKQQLVEDCWGGLAISDDAITQCVSKLRRVLLQSGDSRVETVARVGYRLVAPEPGAPPGVPGRISRRQLVGIGTVAAALAGAGGWLLFRPRVATASESIAVLPFENLSGDPAQVYLSDGIAEEVRNALAQVGGLKISGRISSEVMRHVDAPTAARQLHVDDVLTGSIRRSPSAIRVAAQLIDGKTGIQRWSQTYDRAVGDLLQLQIEIAQDIAFALSLKLSGRQLRVLAEGRTTNPVAHDLYLQGKHALNASDTEATVRQVIALCDAAIGLDGRYADAYALKAMALNFYSGNFAADAASIRNGYVRASEAARTALMIAPDLASGHAALAQSMSGRHDVRGSIQQYRRAQQYSASDPGVLKQFAYTLAETGRTQEALRLINRLIELDPLNGAVFGIRSFVLFYARRYGAAADSTRETLRIAPHLTQQQSLLGDCLSLLGHVEEARKEYARAPAGDPYRLTGEAILAARTGNRQESDRILGQLRRSYGEAPAFQLAQIHGQRGELDQAFAALEYGLTFDPGLDALPTDPFIDPLRPDPRFGALLRSLKLG